MEFTPNKADSSLADHYQSLTDDQVLRLWVERSSLTQEADLALVAEVEKRRLVDDSEGPQRVQEMQFGMQAVAERTRSWSRWWRLGIFFLLGVAFSVFWSLLMGLTGSGSALAVERITTTWLQGNLAIWALSNLFPDEWLTLKRSWIFGFLLNLVAFVILLAALLTR